MKSAIHIFTNELADLRGNYVVARLAHYWRAWGHQVTADPTRAPAAGLGILHIDKTRVMPEEVSPTSLPLLNQYILDISKNRFSELRVYQESLWDGPVIIKSILNCFGAPERRADSPGFFERRRRKLALKSWKLARTLPARDYPVLQSVHAVPAWVWEREDLIVERFMPEKHGDLYSIRGWLFFGNRGYAYRLFSTAPVVKTGNITHFEILEQVPPELEFFRRAHGFDFGKFDYVVVEGRAVVIDMNKTPTTIAPPDSPRLRDLAEGIYSFQGMPES
jgi:hypothetical protein